MTEEEFIEQIAKAEELQIKWKSLCETKERIMRMANEIHAECEKAGLAFREAVYIAIGGQVSSDGKYYYVSRNSHSVLFYNDGKIIKLTAEVSDRLGWAEIKRTKIPVHNL